MCVDEAGVLYCVYGSTHLDFDRHEFVQVAELDVHIAVGDAAGKDQGMKKNEGFWSDVSVLTGDSDEGERVERVGASLGGAPALQPWCKGGQMLSGG